MRMREITVPYMVQEVDYSALRETIERAFLEEYGAEMVHDVHVAHFNPDIIDVTVVVETRQPAMDDLALELSDVLRRQGLRVAIRLSSDSEVPAEDTEG